jgi:unspecific monooxygenase
MTVAEMPGGTEAAGRPPVLGDVVVPPAPRPWTRPQPMWRRLLQVRRNALVTWGPPAYELDVLSGPFLGRKTFLLNAPWAIRRLLVDNHEAYGRTPATIRILKPMIGEGLFLSEGATWRRQRRTSAPAFAPRSLEIVAAVAARRTDATLDLLPGQGLGAVNLLRLVQRLTLEVAGEALFSQAMGSHAVALRAAVERYGRSFARPYLLDFVLPPWIPSPHEYLRRWAGRDFHAAIGRIIAERGAMGPSDPPRDLFDALVTARDPESGQGFSERALRDQVATLIIAGHETTALSLFWALYLLTLAPAVQEAVAEEAMAAGDLDEGTASAALPRLELTRAVMQEALRLYPPAFSIVREARQEDRMGEETVPRGSLMIVSPWVLHRHKKLWREPGRFDPARFLPGTKPPERFSYLPFGTGPRVCIGAQFALTEATLVLAKLVGRFKIEIVGSPTVMPVGVVTTYPERSPPFRLVER